MQNQDICLSCNEKFDSQFGVPKILPCKHSVCLVCLVAEFRKNKQNKCPICQAYSYQNPNDLQSDEQLLNKYKQISQGKQQIETLLEILKAQRVNLKQQLQKINQFHSLISKQALVLLNRMIFNETNQVQIQLQQTIKNINEKVLKLEYIIKMPDYIILNDQRNISQVTTQEDYQNVQNKGNQSIQKLEQYRDQLPNLLEQTFEFACRNEKEKMQINFEGKLQHKEDTKKNIKYINQQIEQRNQDQNLQNYIHYFNRDSYNLHLFDIEKEIYKLVQIQQKVPQFQRSVEYKNKLYLVGGQINNKNIKKTWQVEYDGTCKQLNDMNEAKSSFGIAAAQDMIFVVGGVNNNINPLKKVESLRIESGNK